MAVAVQPAAAFVARPVVGERARVGLAVAAVALAPFHSRWPVSFGGVDFGVLMPADIVMVAGAVFGAADLAGALTSRRLVPRAALGRTWLVFAAVCLLSACAHPTSLTAWNLLRLAGMTVLVRSVAAMVAARRWTLLVRAVAATVLVQGGVAAAQMASEGTIGLHALGERASAFRPIGGVFAPAGTTIHTNTLAVYAAVLATVIGAAWIDGQLTRRADRVLALGAMGVSGALLAASFSRTGTLVLVAAVPILVAGGRRRALLPVVVLAVGIAAVGVVRADGWSDRVEQSTGATSEPVGSGRTASARQAIELMKTDPVLGVGPGNYALVLLNTPRIDALSSEQTIVHNLPLFVAASVGLAGLAALCAWGLALLGAGVRGRWPAWAVLGGLAPALALDVALFLGSGWVVLAAAVGVVVGLGQRDGDRGDDAVISA